PLGGEQHGGREIEPPSELTPPDAERAVTLRRRPFAAAAPPDVRLAIVEEVRRDEPGAEALEPGVLGDEDWRIRDGRIVEHDRYARLDGQRHALRPLREPAER